MTMMMVMMIVFVVYISVGALLGEYRKATVKYFAISVTLCHVAG